MAEQLFEYNGEARQLGELAYHRTGRQPGGLENPMVARSLHANRSRQNADTRVPKAPFLAVIMPMTTHMSTEFWVASVPGKGVRSRVRRP